MNDRLRDRLPRSAAVVAIDAFERATDPPRRVHRLYSLPWIFVDAVRACQFEVPLGEFLGGSFGSDSSISRKRRGVVWWKPKPSRRHHRYRRFASEITFSKRSRGYPANGRGSMFKNILPNRTDEGEIIC